MKRYLFFDLDGTLSDPAEGICGSIVYTLEKGGYEAKAPEAYHGWIGPPLVPSFMNELDVEEEEAYRLVALYRETFSVEGLFRNTVYPGIPELLRALKADGRTLMIVTGKPTEFAERIADYFGVSDCFSRICGIPMSNESVPKEQTLREALVFLGNPPLNECLMIGDRNHDADAAHACGMECAYVLYGYGSAEEAKRCHAEYVLPDVEALKAFLI